MLLLGAWFSKLKNTWHLISTKPCLFHHWFLNEQPYLLTSWTCMKHNRWMVFVVLLLVQVAISFLTCMSCGFSSDKRLSHLKYHLLLGLWAVVPCKQSSAPLVDHLLNEACSHKAPFVQFSGSWVKSV